MKDNKRKNRGYKIVDSEYRKAMRRAVKDKINVANVVEHSVRYYGEGYNIVAVHPISGIEMNVNPIKEF